MIYLTADKPLSKLIKIKREKNIERIFQLTSKITPTNYLNKSKIRPTNLKSINLNPTSKKKENKKNQSDKGPGEPDERETSSMSLVTSGIVGRLSGY